MMRCMPMAGEVTKLDQELAARDDASDKIEVIDGAQEDRDQLRVVARKEWESYAQKSDLAQQALDAHIANVRPAGKDYLMEESYYAGGLRALIKRIEDRLDTTALTVTGKSLGENLERAEVYNDDVIRPLSNPVYHEGPALVFDSYAEMKTAVDDESLDITSDHVMVLRNAGPQGGTGMLEWGMLPTDSANQRFGPKEARRCV